VVARNISTLLFGFKEIFASIHENKKNHKIGVIVDIGKGKEFNISSV
jgi:hypothetical protein